MPNANSSTVDERIVEMRINNQKFESGAKKTLDTLEQLDKSLNNLGKNKTSGFGGIERAFSGISSAFNGLGNIADSVFGKISSKVQALTADMEKLVKSLTIDQINAGWDKYADKTQGVQTIMAATSKDWDDQAAQMVWVNEQLEKLNWFTDETSYNFLDMVNNIGKFTSNGVKLETAVTAMEGISTWAALSGANTQEASRAMYNLSQALATGSVKLIDWKSIENANMATREFKETALETAADLKTLIKVGDGVWRTLTGKEFTTEQFNTELDEKWFTSEVLLQTLQEYGDFTDALKIATDKSDLTTSEFLSAMDAYSEGLKTGDMTKFNEYVSKSALSIGELIPLIEDLSSDQYELGRRAFKAAQEAKTFKEAIDATKDAVSTGWMNIFEKMFGNYLQAKKFWTDVAESLYTIFAEPVNSLNKIVNVAFGDMGPALTTGRELFTEGLLNILHIIEAIGEGVSNVIANVVGIFDEEGNSLHLEHFGETIYYLVEKFNRFTKSALEFIDLVMDPLTRIIAGLINTIKPIFSTIVYSIRRIFDAGKNVLSIVADIYSRLSENGSILLFLNALADIFWALMVPVQIVSTYIHNFFNSLRILASNVGNSEWVQSLADWLLIIGAYFADLASRFREFMASGAWIEYLAVAFNVLKSVVALTFGFIVDGFTKIRTVFQSGGILGVLQAISNKIKDFLKNNPILLKGFEILKTILGAVVGLIFVAASSVASLFKNLDFSKLKINIPFIDKLKGFLSKIKDVLKLKFSGIIAWFESFKNFEIFGRLSDRISKVFDSIKVFFSGLKPDFSGLKGFFAGIKEFFGNAFENLFSDADKIKIAISNFVKAVFGFLADSLKNVSIKDIVDVLKIGLIMAKIGRVFSFISFITTMKKRLSGIPEAITGMFEELGGMFKNIGKSFQGQYFIKLAVAIALISASIYALSTIEENALMRAAAVVGMIGLVLVRMSETIFGKKIYNKQVNIKKFQLVSDMAGMLIGIAMVIIALGYAVGRIGKLDNSLGAFLIIALLIAELGAIMILITNSLNKIKTNKRIDAIGNTLLRVGETMALIAISIRLLVKPILQIAAAIHKYGGDGSVGEAFIIILGFASILGGLSLALIALISRIEGITPAKINAIGNTMLKIGGSMAILAIGIRIISKPLLDIASAIHRYNDGSIGKAAGLITIFGLMLGGIIAGLMYMLTKMDKSSPQKIDKVGNTLLKMAGAMAIIAIAVNILVKPLITIAKAITKFGQNGSILGALIVLIGIMAALAAVSAYTAKKVDGKQLMMVGAGMALFAVGLAVLLPALLTLITMTSGIMGIVSGLKNFWAVLGKLGALTVVVLLFGAAIALFGAGVLAVGLGLLTSAASLLVFAAGIYVLVAALDKVGPAMKSFVQGVMEAGSMITSENLVDLGKGLLILIALAAAVWLLSKALGALDFTKFANLGKSIGSLAGTLVSTVGTMFAKLGETLLAHLPSMQTVIVSLITIIGLFAVGAIRPLVNMIGGALISLIANIYLYIHNNRNVIEYYIFALISDIMNMLTDAIAWGIRMILPTIGHIIWNVLGLDSIVDIIRKIPVYGDKIGDAIEGLFNVDSDKVSEKIKDSFERNEDFWQSVNPFGDIPPEVHEVTEEQAAQLGIDYKAGIETAKETVSEELTGFKDDLATDVGDAFSIDSTSSSVITDNATSMADTGVDSLLGQLGLRSGDISDAGFNVGSGLADGIGSSSSLVSSAAGSLADLVPQSIRSHLLIKSPSRVMAALAAFIPAGIAQGITDNMSDVDDSMTILSSAVIAAMQMAMLRVATVADDSFDFTPTITPVVDLSKVSAAAGNANTIFGGVSAAMRGSLRIASDNAYASMAALQVDDGSGAVVSELQYLSNKVDKLGDAVSNMKIVLDTGLLVGATSSKMNSALGVMQMRSERGN